jgi:hypothetical protein
MKLSFPGLPSVCLAAAALYPFAGAGADLPPVTDVDWQPLAAGLRRLVEALDHLGAPLDAPEQQALEAALAETDSAAASERAQAVLDKLCLFSVNINPESRVTVAQGPARPELVEEGWRLFLVKVERSSWLALRILPSSHTNPIFVEVGAKPIRASRRSAEWCLQGVDRCWSQKQRFLKADELDGARRDYDHAREVYQRLLRECDGPEPN